MSMEILRGGINGPYLAPELPELLQELSTLELFRGWGEQGGAEAVSLFVFFPSRKVNFAVKTYLI